MKCWVLVQDREWDTPEVMGAWTNEAEARSKAAALGRERHAEELMFHYFDAARWVPVHERRYPDGDCQCAPSVTETTLHGGPA